MRLDLRLVELGLAPTRSKAQELIRRGEVEILKDGTWSTVRAPSQKAADLTQDQVRLKSQELLQFVSRAGLKLSAALTHLGLDVSGSIVLDVGISTGGFTDCLLQAGACKVIGLDVGHGQLAAVLAQDSRVELFESVNARFLSQQSAIVERLQDVNLVVIDVSFISLKLILPEVARSCPPHRLLALIKPQFELSASALDKSGVVRSPELLIAAQTNVREAAATAGYRVQEIFASKVKGGDGNQEFFLWAQN